MTRLTRSDIFGWSNTNDSRGLFPELIRRLVLASNQMVDEIVMPYGDSIGRSGLDGFVHASVGSEYVPIGESIWEFGTNVGHVSKANSDFKKRTNGTAQVRQQTLAYRCVTPRHWENKASWALEPGPQNNKITSHWKEVRVYDVDDLLGWLSGCPAVEAWFSRKLGKASAGLRDVEGYWSNVATTDNGAISPDALLGGRDEATKEVQAYWKKVADCTPYAIACRSPAEVVPFVVAATIQSQDASAISTTIVVDSQARWEQLIAEESGLGVIVAPQVQANREQLQQAASQKHRVIYCATSGGTQLPRLSEFELRKALTSSGIEEAEATQHAIQCGGNGQMLLDRISGLPLPAGTVGSRLDARIKAACLLLVGWDGTNNPDRELFSLLCGQPYEDVEAFLVADSRDANGMLFHAAGKFRLLSPEIAWLQNSSLITSSIVNDFADAALYLYSDDDPMAGMSGDERFKAQFFGQRPEFSATLRRNTVHSLAIAGSVGTTRLRLDPSLSSSFVSWIVASIFKDATFERWASFGGELQIFAEAAPDALLDALERDLGPDGPMKHVMDKSETGLFCSPAHSGVLWALERLCWSKDHLERATFVLLRLTRLNPDIQSGNNPSRSIVETLQLYCPQTNADWETRQNAIARILADDPDLAFDIVISLFPANRHHWMHRELPTWQAWAYGYKAGGTWEQLAIELRWCVDKLIDAVGDSEERWASLLKLCGDTEDDQYCEILDKYEQKLADGVFDDVQRRLLWEKINAMLISMEWGAAQRKLNSGDIVDQDEVGTADDSEPHFPGELDRFEKFGERLKQLRDASAPTDPVLAGCHAFYMGLQPFHWSRHFSERFDHEKQAELVTNARQSLVRNVWHAEGLAGIQRLAKTEHVDAAAVGGALASVDDAESRTDELIPLFQSEVEADESLASGFFNAWTGTRTDSLSTEVLPLLTGLPSDETRSAFLRCLPVGPEVWDCVDQQNDAVKSLYWKKAPIPWEIPEGRLSYLARNLIRVSRADRVVDLLAHRRKKISSDEVELVFEALEAFPASEQAPSVPRNQNLRWEIQQLFLVLYKSGMTQVERIVRLEIVYHSVFEDATGRCFQPKGLLFAIRDNPSLFVDLLTYAWKDDEGGTCMADNDQTKALANDVAGLLRELAELPGQTDLCPMPDRTIADWVTEVVKVASERRYLTAIGLVLPDIISVGAWNSIENWPSKDLLEAVNVLSHAIPETFPEHLSVSLSNAHGVHSVDPSDQKETSQAANLNTRANALRNTCPAASRALRHCAGGLESESHRNVEQERWER